ncbi:MAG: AMP-binding protein [Bacteroidota bacterium]
MIHQSFTINGEKYSAKALLEKSRRTMMDLDQPGWYRNIFEFITDWLENEEFEVATSGTTGKPTTLTFPKSAMIDSARRTLEFFDLKPGDPVLLCLPAQYIAGKMMIARALAGGLNLLFAQPETDPWKEWNTKVKFVPVVPLQLRRLLEHPEKHHLFDIVLVGGATIDTSLERKLQRFDPAVFQSFGMTETLTHIAVRRVNGESPSPTYRVLEGFSLTTDAESRLVVQGESLPEPVHTNDVVTLEDEKHFRWHGRYDSVINSGGVKIFPEDVEKKIAGLIYRRFFIAGFPDNVLGQKVVLIIEGKAMEESCLEALHNRIRMKVGKHPAPKQILFYEQFPETDSGKIKRPEVVKALM